MNRSFSKEEMIQASQFRTLSQRAIQEQLREHEKIGVLFPNTGLDAVLMSYTHYEAIVNRLDELEKIIESHPVSRKGGL